MVKLLSNGVKSSQGEKVPVPMPTPGPQRKSYNEDIVLTKHSSQGPSKWAMGLVYPGGALKFSSQNHAWEVKAQAGSGALAVGPRYYRYIKNSGLRLFWGLEADYVSFKGKESKSTGFAGGGFVGGEIPLGDKLGLGMDFGPMYIKLAETKYSQSASNTEYILNMAIYWHFR
jgi:hypothetical protein